MISKWRQKTQEACLVNKLQTIKLSLMQRLRKFCEITRGNNSNRSDVKKTVLMRKGSMSFETTKMLLWSNTKQS